MLMKTNIQLIGFSEKKNDAQTTRQSITKRNR